MYWKFATAMVPLLCPVKGKHTGATWLLDLLGHNEPPQFGIVLEKVMRCWLWAQPGKVSGKRLLRHGLPSDSFLAIRLVAVWANGTQSGLLLSRRQNELTGRQGSEVESGLLNVTVANRINTGEKNFCFNRYFPLIKIKTNTIFWCITIFVNY